MKKEDDFRVVIYPIMLVTIFDEKKRFSFDCEKVKIFNLGWEYITEDVEIWYSSMAVSDRSDDCKWDVTIVSDKKEYYKFQITDETLSSLRCFFVKDHWLNIFRSMLDSPKKEASYSIIKGNEFYFHVFKRGVIYITALQRFYSLGAEFNFYFNKKKIAHLNFKRRYMNEIVNCDDLHRVVNILFSLDEARKSFSSSKFFEKNSLVEIVMRAMVMEYSLLITRKNISRLGGERVLDFNVRTLLK